MIPRHVQMLECGKDGITVADGGETFSISTEALKGNGWDVPDLPGASSHRSFYMSLGKQTEAWC